jgi:LPXTG-motif cell wall-anchored protein
MRGNARWLTGIVGAGFICLMAGIATAQQTSTSTETKRFEVISVTGNKTVLRAQDGTSKEYTVPEDFRFDVNGQKISVHDLKPGMKGTATITTTTTVTPVTVTEVRNGEVIQANGGSVLVHGPNGFKMFTQGDVDKRNITVMRDGKPVDISELHAGDRLSATIVTEKPPKIMTTQQVQASIAPGTPEAAALAEATTPAASSAKAAPHAGASSAASSSAMSAPSTGGTAGKTLPKTASSLPLVGISGLALLAFAALLALRRRVAV